MATSTTDAVLAALSQITGTAALVQAQFGVQTQLQEGAFFHLAHAKQTRLLHLRSVLGGQKIRTVWVSNNIRLLAQASWAGDVRSLEKDFFSDEDPVAVLKKCADLKQSVVVVNNNDAHQGGGSERLARLLQRCPDTVFVAWDWDNHHWLSLSYPLAALSDVYCPAHYENLYPLSRFNAALAVVPCGTVQWTDAFLRERQELLLNAPRSDGPLGKHIYYGGFVYRNQVITTLEPTYPAVRFTTHQFHDLTPEQKFLEWVSFKLHLIVPVLNDVPIRLFDAWATGGIPLLPESLRFSAVFEDMHPRDVVFYSASDVVTPQAMIEKARALFDADGQMGILRRHQYGLGRHHGEQRLRRMLEVARELVGFTGP